MLHAMLRVGMSRRCDRVLCIALVGLGIGSSWGLEQDALCTARRHVQPAGRLPGGAARDDRGGGSVERAGLKWLLQTLGDEPPRWVTLAG
jgi:hypothetical protein